MIACPNVTCEFHPQDGRKPRRLEGSRVIVWGDHYAATDTVAYLASIGKDVIIVTDRPEFASSVEVIHMYVLRKRFQLTDAEALSSKPFKFAVTVHESCTIAEIRENEVVLIDKNLERTTVGCDHVVSCWTKPETVFLGEMKAAGLNVVNIGDAVKPRNLHAAVKEGASVGLSLDANNLCNSNDALVGELPIDIAGQLTR